jgi:threonylcarbamoyladenosine tRNA methylthiotransferase MtaB
MKVYFDTVGCRLNQAEIEHMAGQFRAAGHQILESAEGADLVVVNTCSVTAAASSDSRQKVRQANQAGAKQILLTGCWATLEPEKAAGLTGVTEVISNLEKMNIPLRVLEPGCEDFDFEPIARKPLPGSHLRTRAFIKAQDGCDNFCTFCVTRLARGVSKSISKQEILKEIQLAEQGGVHEVVLTGVHLGSWGRDGNRGEILADLLGYLLEHTQVERIRLSSVEPWDLDKRFFNLWQNPRLCRHLHLPLQSGSAAVLKRMARHTNPEAFASLVKMARELIPGVAITTDIIVGFPGETNEEFEESLDFVRQMAFSGGHVFKYSPREGTSATRISGKVDGVEARKRAARMRNIISNSEIHFLQGFVDHEVQVLWEASGQPENNGWSLHGLSDNYLKVVAWASDNRWNRIDSVKIIEAEKESLVGEITT